MKKSSNKISKLIAYVLKKELQTSAESAGSRLSYQPRIPNGLNKFKKK